MRVNTDKEALLSYEDARALLEYDPISGIIKRLKNKQLNLLGKPAGTLNKVDGYIRIMVKGESYLAHRLAWLLYTGAWPRDQVDHENQRRADNYWENLVPSSYGANAKNKTMYKNNRSGHTSIYIESSKTKGDRFVPELRFEGRLNRLGTFDTLEEAQKVLKSARIKHEFHKNHGNRKEES